MAPGIFHFGKATAQKADISADRSADLTETPVVIPCQEPFFVGSAGKSSYWYAPSVRPIVCYDRAGYQPTTREPLALVTQPIVNIIKKEQAETEKAAKAAQEERETARILALAKLKEAEAAAAKAKAEAAPSPTPTPDTKPGEGWGPATTQESRRPPGDP
jgi:hypothetical protein